MTPPAFLRRLGACKPESHKRSLRPTLIFTERAAVTAHGAEVTTPGLGAEPSDVPLFHANSNSPEAQRNHG